MAIDGAPRRADQKNPIFFSNQRDDIEFTVLEPIRIPSSNSENFPHDLIGSYSAPQATYAAPINEAEVIAAGVRSPDCKEGLVRRIDGECVPPTVNRNLFVYTAPSTSPAVQTAAKVPDPQIDLNYVFVKVPNVVQQTNPVVIPPPQQKTAVYLLQENQEIPSPPVIEVPYEPQNPDVYFVNYDEGQNLDLPGGIDLQTALSNSITEGTLITGSDISDSSYVPNIDPRTAAGSGAAVTEDSAVESASPVVTVVAVEEAVEEIAPRSEIEPSADETDTDEDDDAGGDENAAQAEAEIEADAAVQAAVDAVVEAVDVRTAPETAGLAEVMPANVIELMPVQGDFKNLADGPVQNFVIGDDVRELVDSILDMQQSDTQIDDDGGNQREISELESPNIEQLNIAYSERNFDGSNTFEEIPSLDGLDIQIGQMQSMFNFMQSLGIEDPIDIPQTITINGGIRNAVSLTNNIHPYGYQSNTVIFPFEPSSSALSKEFKMITYPELTVYSSAVNTLTPFVTGFSDASSVQRAEPILATSVVGGETGISGGVEITEAVSTRLAVGDESAADETGIVEEPVAVVVEVTEAPVESVVQFGGEEASQTRSDGNDLTGTERGEGEQQIEADNETQGGDEEETTTGEEEEETEREEEEESEAEGDEENEAEVEEGKEEEEEEVEPGQGRSLASANSATAEGESTFIVKGTPTVVTLPADFTLRSNSFRAASQASLEPAPGVQLRGNEIPGILGETKVILGKVNVIDTELDAADETEAFDSAVFVNSAGIGDTLQQSGGTLQESGGTLQQSGVSTSSVGQQGIIRATPASLIGRTSLNLGTSGKVQSFSGATRVSPTSSVRLSSLRSQGRRLSPRTRTLGKTLAQPSGQKINSVGARLSSRVPLRTIGAVQTSSQQPRLIQQTRFVTSVPRASFGLQQAQLNSANILRTGFTRSRVAPRLTSTVRKVSPSRSDKSSIILDHLEGRINSGKSLPLISNPQSRIKSIGRVRPGRFRVSSKS